MCGITTSVKIESVKKTYILKKKILQCYKKRTGLNLYIIFFKLYHIFQWNTQNAENEKHLCRTNQRVKIWHGQIIIQ